MASPANSPECRAYCPVCTSADVAEFAEIAEVPVHCNLLWPTRNEAIRAPKGDIRLGFCRRCGHIFNVTFDSQLVGYTEAYENSLHFSPLFQAYATQLATNLIERYHLYGKTVIEIGCGKGEFLKLLCKLGGNRGIGFDPSYAEQRTDISADAELVLIRDLYSEQHPHRVADFLCCRQVLEHVANPREFVEIIRRGIGKASSSVFFEVPNVLFMLRDLSIWDIIYEHFSYFSLSSLAYLVASCGFNIRRVYRSYAEQFLCVEASISEVGNNNSEGQEDFQDIARYVTSFTENYQHKIDVWRSSLERLTEGGRRIVVWGAGSKGVTFLNTLQDTNTIGYVVDINPQKQGRFVAGTGQQIVSPEFLQLYQPDVIIVMNVIYQKEIQEVTEKLGLSPKFSYA
jgi:trans-aconitate methyltransferase